MLLFREKCIQIIDENRQEIKYSFNDIFGVSVSGSEASQNFLLQIHTFSKEETEVRKCCCRRTEIKRTWNVISLASVSQTLAITWRYKLLWAL